VKDTPVLVVSLDRGHQEIADRLDQRRASFEASLHEAPQDEHFS
jgi:hypothetical protein